MKYRLTTVAVTFALAGSLAVLLPTVAFASLAPAPAPCAVMGTPFLTFTQNISNDPDSGNHDNWALDTFTEDVSVWLGSDGQTYCANATTNNGTFITTGPESPNTGAPMSSGITGTFSGGENYTLPSTLTLNPSYSTTTVSNVTLPANACGGDGSACLSGAFSDWVSDAFTNANPSGSSYVNTYWLQYLTPSNGSWIDSDPVSGGNDTGDITGTPTPSAVTNDATNITGTDATLNGTNGDVAADGESFWVSIATFDTSTPNIPANVYSTPILSGVGTDTAFSDPLSLVTTSGIITGGVPGNMPPITPNTTYYYAAWSEVGGTWYPGAIKHFTTSAAIAPPAPTLVSPVNGTIWTTATLTGTNWNSVTDSIGGITYIYQSSNSTSTNPDGSFTAPAYTSGPLTATTIPTPGTPPGVYYWHVEAKDSDGNTSPWSDTWTFTVNNTVTPPASCPAGTTQNLVETVPVDSSSVSAVSSATTLLSGKQYLLVSSGTWQNGTLNVADTAYASVDDWASIMQGYNISPYFLGTNEFQLQVDGSFVNWGSYSPTHTYEYLYTGTGSPVSLGVFDGDSTTNPPTANPSWYGDNSGSLSVSIYSCDPSTGTLTVNKIANGGNGTFNFTSNIPGHANFSITTTGGTGSASFTNVPVGTYQVTEVAQNGWTESDAGTCSAVGVESAGNDSCTITNTKNPKLGAIYGTKYEDRDGDGTLKDGDHHRLEGVTINLTGPVDATAVTDSHGNYSFNSLPAGTYHVSETVPAGWEETVPLAGSYTVVLGAGQVAKNKDFGDFKFGTISGMKYGDVNGNGRKDPGELGLSGWTIQLKKNNTIIATTVTAADGSYSFSGLTAGVYRLSEVMKTGWVQTDHPSSVWILSGTNATHEDFGNHDGPLKPTYASKYYYGQPPH